MENTIAQPKSSASTQMAVVGMLMAFTFSTVVIAFGIDAVAMGAHDVFHDFRHVMGMPCH